MACMGDSDRGMLIQLPRDQLKFNVNFLSIPFATDIHDKHEGGGQSSNGGDWSGIRESDVVQVFPT